MWIPCTAEHEAIATLVRTALPVKRLNVLAYEVTNEEKRDPVGGSGRWRCRNVNRGPTIQVLPISRLPSAPQMQEQDGARTTVQDRSRNVRKSERVTLLSIQNSRHQADEQIFVDFKVTRCSSTSSRCSF